MKKALIIVLILATGLMDSCASTGRFMPLTSEDTVIGTVQISFTVRNTLNGRDALNILAYAKLLEMAQLQYGRDGTPIDVRDIMWASGQPVDSINTEYSAVGKVIKMR